MKRKLYVGKDYNGRIITIVIASSIESARAYWQGKGIIPYSEQEITLEEEQENEKLGFVTPLLTTKEVKLSSLSYEARREGALIVVS